MHKTTEKCLQALLEGRNLKLVRDEVVREYTHGREPLVNQADISWYYHSTPIVRYDSKKHIIYVNRYGWHTSSTSIRISSIARFFDYVNLPKKWEGDLAIKVTSVLHLEDGKTTYKGKVIS